MMDEVPVGGSATPSRIASMPSATARRICSGQVITSVTSVVKELVENSLDAGCTSVEIVVVDGGLEGITVSDDGHGIDLSCGAAAASAVVEDAVPLLAKRASSKQERLSNGGNTVSVGAHDTLGFRGEALHSLAQVANVKIVSMTPGASHAWQLTYDASHSTSSIIPATRAAVGTTVSVTDLFASIPVRRNELAKGGGKKHVTQVAALVKAWAVMRPDVRFYAEAHDTATNARTTLCSTKGGGAAGDALNTVGDVHGGKVAASLAQIEWKCDGLFSITGFVSKVGSGRLSRDLQVFLLDGRLVELKKWAQVISDAFAECHPHTTPNRTPAFFLAITTEREKVVYDVNVAPDKRSVLANNESELLAELHRIAKAEFALRSNVHAVARQSAAAMVASQQQRARLDLVMTPISATSISPRRFLCSTTSTSSATKKVERGGDSNSASTLEGGDDGATVVVREASDEGCVSRHAVAPEPIRFSLEDVAAVAQDELAALAAAAAAAAAVGAKHGRDAPGDGLLEGDKPAAKRKRGGGGGTARKFSALSATSCEQELRDAICKSSFADMKIVGQFNKGFVVVVLDRDVFVVDQHAADEKFNYERLLAAFEARPQMLLAPARVDMESEERELALEHADELRRRGFIVERDPASSSCVLVKSIPLLPYDVVQPADVRELTAQLLETGRVVRQLRAVWHSMATKACRSSIMIGTALNEATQTKIVRNMGAMDHPWNCPHGRPTMRHVGIVPETHQVAAPARAAPSLASLIPAAMSSPGDEPHS